MRKYHIYTDASKGQGNNCVGVSFVIVDYKLNRVVCEFCKCYNSISVNRGELLAIYNAISNLVILKEVKKVVIYSDSLYSCNVINKRCKSKRNGDVIKNILNEINKYKFKISITWIKKNSNKYNKLADYLANYARLHQLKSDYIVVRRFYE